MWRFPPYGYFENSKCKGGFNNFTFEQLMWYRKPLFIMFPSKSWRFWKRTIGLTIRILQYKVEQTIFSASHSTPLCTLRTFRKSWRAPTVAAKVWDLHHNLLALILFILINIHEYDVNPPVDSCWFIGQTRRSLTNASGIPTNSMHVG